MSGDEEAVASRGLDSAPEYLSWENLSAQPPWSAFWQSLKELAFHPADFFDKMAVSGGLHEPLTFLWIVIFVTVLPTFPLALSYFGLTAPDPGRVPAEVYHAHLLLPRAAGFVTVLLPLALVLCAFLAVVCGSVLHLAAGLFGACRWEGSVSVWCYSTSSGLVPVTASVGAGAVVSILCWLCALFWPGAREGAASVACVALWGLLGAALLVGIVAFLVALLTGCARSLKLSGARGAAAALLGLVLVGMPLILSPLSVHFWGGRAGLIVLGVFAFFVILLAVLCTAARIEAQG